jgi:RNA polymerase sigma-70 factor (ECF subfamily)
MASLAGFEDFYDETSKRVLTHACLLAQNMVDAEQAVVDAYAETAKRWDRISGYEAKEAYVRMIVRQRLAREHRRRWRRRSCESWGQAPSRPADPALSAEVRLVLDLLQMLPAKQRAVMALACQEYTSGEIAQELRMAPSTVRTHLTRARNRLRDALGLQPGPGADRIDEFASAVYERRGNVSPLPGREQEGNDQLTGLLQGSEAELREAFATDQARMERIRAAVAARIAGRRGRSSR